MARTKTKTRYFGPVKNAKHCDFGVVILVSILVIFSVAMVFSASYYKSLSATGSPYDYLRKQLFFVVTGFVGMAFLSYLDYHIFKKIWGLILLVGIALLGAVLVIGTPVNGAQRWIFVGPISIMPGEIAKFVMIVVTAVFFSRETKRVKKLFTGLIPIIVLTGGVAFLIYRQPNLSTAITVCGIVAGMLFLAGLQWRYVILGVGGLGALIYVVSQSGSYQAQRIMSFLDPFADPLGEGYQVVQSLYALGSGGLFGLGLGKSVQKTLYLPEPQNDFILAIIGEELGFVGIFLLMLVFIILVWRCFLIAMDAPDRLGMLLAGGVALMIGIQVVLNVAVVTSSMPATGIALPFISYGGNATWIFMGSAGMVLNISRQRLKKEPDPEEASRHREVRVREMYQEQPALESESAV